MRWIWLLHLLLLGLGWVVALAWGTAGLVVASAALLALHVVLWRADLVQFPSWLPILRPARRRSRRGVPSYAPISNAVRMGAHSRRQFDLGLRRRLQHVASERLTDRHGIDLSTDPAAAREVLGDPAWRLLDPQRRASGGSGEGGIPLETMRLVIDRLERM